MAYQFPEAIIADALGAAYVGLGLSYTTSYPSAPAPDIPLTGYYVQIFDLRNTNGRPFVANDSKTLFQGIYQITVSTPIGKGEIALLDAAGGIANGFYALGKIAVTGGHIRITQRPSVVTMKSADGARWEAHISINWRAHL